jgi:small subunit ribosomal protein S16
MVKLRLRRRGRKKAPFYDIVAIDGRARRDGASIERVGYIDPMTSPKTIVLNVDRAIYWLNVGAQPTLVVRQILSREGVLLRNTLLKKGHSEAEADAAVAQHRERAVARWQRMKDKRVARAEAKVKAAAAAEAAAAAAAAAPAPAVEAPAQEAAPEASAEGTAAE